MRLLPVTLAVIGTLAVQSYPAAAQKIKDDLNASQLESLAFVNDRLNAAGVLEPVDDAQSSLDADVRDGWASFRLGASDKWKAHIDKRNGRVELAEGDGIAWIPGRGNGLSNDDVPGLNGKKKPDLQDLENIARGFLPRVAKLLGVTPNSLVLNQGRSGQPAEHVWFVDFDVTSGGIPIDGARVVFRVNNGNLIQFGSENLPSGNVRTPAAKYSREQALAVLDQFVGGFSADDTFVDPGSRRLVPVSVADNRVGEGFAFGKGRGIAGVWQFVFRRASDNGTWQAKVDSLTGEVLELKDINHYAQVTGGAKILGVSTNLPAPFANLSSGGFTNSAGVYTFPGGTVTSTMAGQYVRISDNCGAISLAGNASGDIAFGTSTGTNCTTPGVGGAGNTHAARTQYLPPEPRQGAGPRLAAQQHLAQRPAHGQRQHQPHLQRLLERLDGQLLPLRRRLRQHG